MEDLKSKIASLEKGIQGKATPAPMKKMMEKQLEKLKEQLVEEEKKAESKKVEKVADKTEKKPSVKKETPKAVKKEVAAPAKKSAKKEDSDDDNVTCEELMAKYEERKKKHDKAAKNYATTSISEKIGNNMASAVSKAFDNISAEELKKSPKKYIEKFEIVQKEAKSFLGKLKNILGEDFDKEDILAPLEEVIQKHIDNIKTKIKK